MNKGEIVNFFDFVGSMLHEDPKKRPKINEVIKVLAAFKEHSDRKSQLFFPKILSQRVRRSSS